MMESRIGHISGKLTVISEVFSKVGNNGVKSRYVTCECSCGLIKDIRCENLFRKERNTKSCGCSRLEGTHGKRHSLTYSSWSAMKSRCTNQNQHAYSYYGARGISYDPLWESFDNFYADMGDRPGKDFSLERKDNDLGYCKDNCKWASDFEQSRNRRDNRLVTYKGKTQCVSDWEIELGFGVGNIKARLHCGWDEIEALETPIGIRRNGAKAVYQGEIQLITDLAKKHNISRSLLCYRLKSGWPIERALNTPVNVKRVVGQKRKV